MSHSQLDYFIDTLGTELQDFIQSINKEKINEAAQIISDAKRSGGRVHITGIGKPSHVSQYISALFSSTGTPAYFLDATESVHGSAGQVMSHDVVIAISNSGETAELQSTIEALKKMDIKLISVTGGKESWLAQNSDLSLFAGVDEEGDHFNKPPRASIIAEILILQAVSVVLQEKSNFNLEQYRLWHPGGALGKSLEVK